MRLERYIKILVIAALILGWVVQGRANEPVFLQWLAMDDPGDLTIRAYWDQYAADELSPPEIVDLGTMLFTRGYPRDAERLYHEAVKRDKNLYEAWFRIGLLNHQLGKRNKARRAYHHCLKIFKGHGWCNFYLGLLEEQDHHAKEAVKYYTKAFRYAPVLADEKVNPEIRSSELALGAWLVHSREQEFHEGLPMAWLSPEKMSTVRRSSEKEVRVSMREAKTPVVELKEVRPPTQQQSKAKTTPKSNSAESTATPVVTMKHQPAKNRPRGHQAQRKRTRPAAAKTPVPVVTPRPTPKPSSKSDLPFGLAGDHGVSSDGYPGF